MKEKKKKRSNFWILLAIIIILFAFSTLISGCVALFVSSPEVITGNVAIIPVVGPITTFGSSGLFDEDVVVSSEIVRKIEKAAETDSVKAIVFEINSPGGSAVASDEIGQAIKKLEKPTVAWIRQVGASGGYWVASTCDYIFANRMSITGSIGVIGSYLNFAEFIDDYNVSYERFVSGDMKDFGSPFKRVTAKERKYWQSKLDMIHDFFKEEVATNRDLTFEEVDTLADGGVFLGVEAFESGLVDELGGYDEIEAYLEKLLGEEVEFSRLSTKKSFIEKLAELTSGNSFEIGRGLGYELKKDDELIKV